MGNATEMRVKAYNIKLTQLMQWMTVIIARINHHGYHRLSNWYVGTWLLPPIHFRVLGQTGKEGLLLAIGIVTVERQHVG